MSTQPPAYQHYARDWLVGTAHLTLEEQGAYQRLLDHEWDSGPLLRNHDTLARLLSVDAPTFERLWVRLQHHFVPYGRGRKYMVNKRLEAVRAQQLTYRQRQAEKGVKGASKRWHGNGHNPAMPVPCPDAWPDDSTPTATASVKRDKVREPLGARQARPIPKGLFGDVVDRP